MSVLPNDKCSRISSFTEKLIRDNGYLLEVHHVTTEDGYINSIYHIMHGTKLSEEKKVTYPVLLMHGLMSSVAEFVLLQRSFAYYLVDNGFDVWLPNCRGTTFSREHEEYDHMRDPEKYWNFSFHEIGYYDHAASIDYILHKTGFKKLFYIGYSQGSTTFFVLTSTRPEYNEKIQLACLLSPVVFFKNAPAFPTRFFFCYFMPLIKRCSEVFRKPLYEVPFSYWIRCLCEKHGEPGTFAVSFIKKILDIIGGHKNPDNNTDIDFTQFGITTPNSASFKQGLHYSQLITHNEFQQYDYGSEENFKKYGSEKPPFYDLEKITAPAGIFYSKNDMYYGTKDIDNLANKLKNCVKKFLIQNDGFNHLDFIYNNDVIPLVYKNVVDLMREYTS